MWRELEDLKSTPPSAEELARVRAQVIAGLVYERDSITSQATAIGQLETVGLSWKLIDQELAELESRHPGGHPASRQHLLYPRPSERRPRST